MGYAYMLWYIFLKVEDVNGEKTTPNRNKTIKKNKNPAHFLLNFNDVENFTTSKYKA